MSGRISGNPLLLPARHWFNLALLLTVIYFGYQFVVQSPTGTAENPAGWVPLIIMTALSLLFGIHMVMAIGGADMPVVVSMLNSYSGWAAASIGFMLGNDLVCPFARIIKLKLLIKIVYIHHFYLLLWIRAGLRR